MSRSKYPATLGAQQKLLRRARASIVAALTSEGVGSAPGAAAPAPGALADQVRSTPADPGPMAAALVAEYPPETLVATHCFRAGADHAPELIEGLRAPHAPVILLRERPDIAPFAIAADGRPEGSPLLAADFLRDHHTRRRIEALGGVLLATGTVAEAAPWLQLEMPAAPIGDLADDRSPRADKFYLDFRDLIRADSDEATPLKLWLNRYNTFYARPPYYEDFDSSCRPQRDEYLQQLRLDAMWVAPAWDPTSWQLRADLAGDAGRLLSELESRAPVELGGVALWAPPPETLAIMHEAHASGRQEAFLALSRESLLHDLQRISPDMAAERASAPPEVDLATARRRLVEALASPCNEDRRPAADAYRAAAEEQIVAPLMGGAGDPIRRAQGAVAAAISRHFIDAELDLLLRVGGVADARASGDHAFDRFIKLADKLIKITTVLGDGRGQKRR